MILLQNITLPLSTDFGNLEKIVAAELKISQKEIKSVSLHKKSVDARHKNNIVFCCSFLVEAENEKSILKRCKKATSYNKKDYVWLKAEDTSKKAVVVGFGPAGMFAALTLSRAGIQVTVLERGQDADTRSRDIKDFLEGGELNTESNVQFGEGGAGTFSDGKLNTGIKDERISVVLKTFAECGADEKILYEAKPHIGTDVLVQVVKNIRKRIIKLGGEILFGAKFVGFESSGAAVRRAVAMVGGEKRTFDCDYLVLAIGHSARDTYKALLESGLEFIRKPFSVGARIEHRQADINKSLYGEFANHPALGAADYKMAVHLENGRGVYTFCMCPGGEVINASSEMGMTCVNGMSNSARDGENANSALLVEVRPEDLEGDSVLAGIEFQREIERRAFCKEGVPFCYVGELTNESVNLEKAVVPTIKPRAVKTDINSVLPNFVVQSLKEALPLFGKKISGFDSPEATLTFPETRSSAPVRILRNEEYEALNFAGIYPAGEGAGYAGGIMSAAIDGMKIAEAIIKMAK